MGDVLQFAGVVGVALVAALGWRWGTFWINRIRGEHTEALDQLEERVLLLEEALDVQKNVQIPGPADEA